MKTVDETMYQMSVTDFSALENEHGYGIFDSSAISEIPKHYSNCWMPIQVWRDNEGTLWVTDKASDICETAEVCLKRFVGSGWCIDGEL